MKVLRGRHEDLSDDFSFSPPAEDLKCIRCSTILTQRSNGFFCVVCDMFYPVVKGIPVCLLHESLQRADIENKHWSRHPIEGYDKPPQLAINHKRNYASFFLKRVLNRFTFNGRVLEIGAGSCWASTMVKLLNPSCKTYASDISLQALLKGIQVSIFMGGRVDHAVVCDAHRLPFKDGLFSTVFGVAVLHHLEAPEKALKEVWRVLTPGGFYIGIREGLAGNFVKPLYHLLGGGWSEKRRFGAVELVHTYEEWTDIFSGFEVEFGLKRDFRLGLSLLEKTYYATVSLFSESLLRHLAATLEIVAKKTSMV